MPIRPDYGANRLRRRPPATRFVPRGSSQRAGRDCLNGSGPVKGAQAAHGAKTSSYDLKRNMRVRYLTLKSADVWAEACKPDRRGGWLWANAYGIDARSSSFVVECSAQTWAGLGFDTPMTLSPSSRTSSNV